MYNLNYINILNIAFDFSKISINDTNDNKGYYIFGNITYNGWKQCENDTLTYRFVLECNFFKNPPDKVSFTFKEYTKVNCSGNIISSNSTNNQYYFGCAVLNTSSSRIIMNDYIDLSKHNNIIIVLPGIIGLICLCCICYGMCKYDDILSLNCCNKKKKKTLIRLTPLSSDRSISSIVKTESYTMIPPTPSDSFSSSLSN